MLTIVIITLCHFTKDFRKCWFFGGALCLYVYLRIIQGGLSGYSEGISAVVKSTIPPKENFTVIINDLDNLQLIKSLRTDIRNPF